LEDGRGNLTNKKGKELQKIIRMFTFLFKKAMQRVKIFLEMRESISPDMF
jgi:hypothetical protein